MPSTSTHRRQQCLLDNSNSILSPSSASVSHQLFDWPLADRQRVAVVKRSSWPRVFPPPSSAELCSRGPPGSIQADSEESEESRGRPFQMSSVTTTTSCCRVRRLEDHDHIVQLDHLYHHRRRRRYRQRADVSVSGRGVDDVTPLFWSPTSGRRLEKGRPEIESAVDWSNVTTRCLDSCDKILLRHSTDIT